jgi:glyceraldehyde-3-phosphate dehydrogenase (NADP+)
VVDAVPVATPAHVESALAAALEGAQKMAALTAYERSQILLRAAAIVEDRADELARVLTLEQGKPIFESRGEVGRVPDMLRLCAFEAAQLRGETLPLDAAANGARKLGFTLRVPCGIVVAITPFNFPVLLVVHKIGPALVTGNTVIVKPAPTTPLTDVQVVRILNEAGLPPGVLNIVPGPAEVVGESLLQDPRVRKIAFTGSTKTGKHVMRAAAAVSPGCFDRRSCGCSRFSISPATRRIAARSLAALAVVGAGVAGLTAAYLLQRRYDIDTRHGTNAHAAMLSRFTRVLVESIDTASRQRSV